MESLPSARQPISTVPMHSISRLRHLAVYLSSALGLVLMLLVGVAVFLLVCCCFSGGGGGSIG